MDNPKAICPSNFFGLGGIIKRRQNHKISMQQEKEQLLDNKILVIVTYIYYKVNHCITLSHDPKVWK